MKIFPRSLAVLIAATCLSAHAQQFTLGELEENPGTFLQGLASGWAVHELGHVIVARSMGYSVGHQGLSITYGGKDMTAHDQERIASAGFQAQWISSEVAFSSRKKNNSTFAAGFICAHLAISAAYLTVLKNQKLSDSVGYANATGLSTGQIVWRAAIPALLDGWRLFGNDVPKWVPMLSVATKAVGITAIWTY